MQVVVYEYSCHLAIPPLADKLGSNIILRRSLHGESLLCYLVNSLRILSLTAATLHEMLVHCCVRMAKNTTKPAKIRKILMLQEVVQNCKQEKRDEIEKKLQEQEEQAKKKTNETWEVEEACKGFRTVTKY